MDIKTEVIHERRHYVRLSKEGVEAILRAHLKNVSGAVGKLDVRFEWGEDSVDSGLRKEPCITIRATEDLSGLPTAG